MISIDTLNLLIAVDILMILFSVIDSRNRLHANIVVAIISGILSAYIAASSVSGAVYDVIGATQEIMNSPSMQNLFNFISTIMFIYSALMIYEVITIMIAERKEKAVKNNGV